MIIKIFDEKTLESTKELLESGIPSSDRKGTLLELLDEGFFENGLLKNPGIMYHQSNYCCVLFGKKRGKNLPVIQTEVETCPMKRSEKVYY